MKNIFYIPLILSCISALQKFCFNTEFPFVCFLIGYWFSVVLIVVFTVRQKQMHSHLFLIALLYVLGAFVLWIDLWFFSTQCWRCGILRAKRRFWVSFSMSIIVMLFTYSMKFTVAVISERDDAYDVRIRTATSAVLAISGGCESDVIRMVGRREVLK